MATTRANNQREKPQQTPMHQARGGHQKNRISPSPVSKATSIGNQRIRFNTIEIGVMIWNEHQTRGAEIKLTQKLLLIDSQHSEPIRRTVLFEADRFESTNRSMGALRFRNRGNVRISTATVRNDNWVPTSKAMEVLCKRTSNPAKARMFKLLDDQPRYFARHAPLSMIVARATGGFAPQSIAYRAQMQTVPRSKGPLGIRSIQPLINSVRATISICMPEIESMWIVPVASICSWNCQAACSRCPRTSAAVMGAWSRITYRSIARLAWAVHRANQRSSLQGEPLAIRWIRAGESVLS